MGESRVSSEEIAGKIEETLLDIRIRQIVQEELRRDRPKDVALPKICPICGGVGSIPGFWFGTVKTCTSCHGKGRL
jgi:hypothetical protein